MDRVVPRLLQTALQKRGARFKEGPAWQPNVVVSGTGRTTGRLVTGQNPASANLMAQTMITIMKKRGTGLRPRVRRRR